ncbi:hypothetical protein J7S95_16150 [Providencia stuartii]|nr:hypothetical protein [Providencia stuartii]MBQ0458243.1 hypothetical protein [Providencia stuartii]
MLLYFMLRSLSSKNDFFGGLFFIYRIGCIMLFVPAVCITVIWAFVELKAKYL